MRLEEIVEDAVLRGIAPDIDVTVVRVQWYGADALNLVYRRPDGTMCDRLLFRSDEARISLVEQRGRRVFDGDGAAFRLAAESYRIRLAYVFDPLLAVHTSQVIPLPHQIAAVYETMLQRHPLRFLLADDPGAGKTIMTGLLIKELILRADIQRCLIICPGNLVEQWQDELRTRFRLHFEIMTNEKIAFSSTGNWFLENNMVIARLDKLARDTVLQSMLDVPENHYDLVVIDEAHKLSASFFGEEIKATKRYRLGQLVSRLARHFLLLTATPHNGKEEDFQLFLALLDSDRFEGRYREGVHHVDVSDVMRRMVKEKLLRFDGTPLFPERIAYTVPYRLSPDEEQLYNAVSAYVREEYNRAESLRSKRLKGTIGWALTILQRRLASSPEAIYQSLHRRRERLERYLHDLERRGIARLAEDDAHAGVDASVDASVDVEDFEDVEDISDDISSTSEGFVLDRASAASTIAELQSEIATLKRLEEMADHVRQSEHDAKWRELSRLLDVIFSSPTAPASPGEYSLPQDTPAYRRKLVVFTEHRDTLTHLQRKITNRFGSPRFVAVIHGGMARDDRRNAQDRFLNDADVRVLVATDAAGEGINLQRAHLMINYDLPWNPNRLEQRFGRIHRIGQTEVCHVWNLVADGTREGDVYHRLLEKLEEARRALGGQVFDVLGKIQFSGKPLRELMIEAVRYGDRPDVRARLSHVIEHAVNADRLSALVREQALAYDVMDIARVTSVRESMERAEAHRLQPLYIETFFLEAFRRLGGVVFEREPHRYEVPHVPSSVRDYGRRIAASDPVTPSYERICFEKRLINLHGYPVAEFVCPGHPLLDAVIDMTFEQNRTALQRGVILVDDRDWGTTPRALFLVEHVIHGGTSLQSSKPHVISRRIFFVEIDAHGHVRDPQSAPYLDYRPLAENEPDARTLLARPELEWVAGVEQKVINEAVSRLIPEHVREVSERHDAWIKKTREAVHDRLTKEIAYWDRRAEELKIEERAGKRNARMTFHRAQKIADDLRERRVRRMSDLDRQAHISPMPANLLGGALVVPRGFIAAIAGDPPIASRTSDTHDIAARARAIVMEIERRLGYEPVDRESERLGYDIESRAPGTGKLRFIEVKGRSSDADVVTVTRNEILTALNKPDDYILAIVEFQSDGHHRVRYVRRPFHLKPDFGVTSVNYEFAELFDRGEEPA